MASRMLRVIMALFLTLTLILVASAPADAAPWPTITAGMKQIPAGQYFVVKHFIAQANANVTYEIQIREMLRLPVDALLMDRQNFELYKSGLPFFYYPDVSALNVDFATKSTGVGGLIDGIEYYLVIDNTNRPSGGAFDNFDVNVFYFFSGTNIRTIGEIDLVLVILVVLVVAVTAIVILVVFLMRKPRIVGPVQPQTSNQPSQQPGMKACPRCGTQASMEFAYCQKCGWRF